MTDSAETLICEWCGMAVGIEDTFQNTETPDGWFHDVLPASRAGHWTPGTVMSVAGHVAPIAKAREVMGIDWTTREELAEAIPPAYTEYVGVQLLAALETRRLANVA